jgi:UDP-N-acetylmuramoylalanine--D-glutamate ligase
VTVRPTACGALSGPVAVVGFAVTGQAVARVLRRFGLEVVAVEDAATPARREAARRLGVELIAAPDRAVLAAAVGRCALVVASPGVPPRHPVFELVEPDRLVSEIELAYRLSPVPLVAVTGTNGKTTVTALVTAMLVASGVRAEASGNIGQPLISTVTAGDADLVVAEVSSFQLALTSSFRPVVAAWLNAAENHLDWHPSFGDYVAAKRRIWANQRDCDVAVVNGDDPIVAAAASTAPARVVTFGQAGSDYRLVDGRFLAPDGELLATNSDLVRDLPHDRLNALGALATALEAGALADACRTALRTTAPPAHRLTHVATLDGVAYYDDSKATTPAAVIAALQGFSSVVLILGGRNKGLDLATIRRTIDGAAGLILRGVVAIGEASAEVVAAFAPDHKVVEAGSMGEAVAIATGMADPGDAVLLSPGCASFDWYESYAARGDDFVAAVRRLHSSELRDRAEA